MTKEKNPKIIFFGNGPLAENTLKYLKSNGCEIIFHAHEKSDLEEVARLKKADKNQEIHGVLASFGAMLKKDLLDLFEPEGILNIHPSYLPQYRGPSPIETALLNGDNCFYASVMKIAEEMDAGPIYATFGGAWSNTATKEELYDELPRLAVDWLCEGWTEYEEPLYELMPPNSQDHLSEKFGVKTSYTRKFTKNDSPLNPGSKTAHELECQIRAFAGFPKSTYTFFERSCIVHSAHVATPEESAKILSANSSAPSAKNVPTLYIQCYDNSILIIDELQPAGKKIMDAKSFLNGYAK